MRMSSLDDVFGQLDGIAAWQEALYRDLHAHPELPMQEARTRSIVAEQLREFGFQVTELGGGVVGVLRNGDGPTVLFRADMDALPVTEATGLDYASVNEGVMHACGHDVHVACGLGAARLLAASTGQWSGTYIALFQPAEEIGAGARSMVEAGLTDAVPKPDVALGQHVYTYEAGHVQTKPGPIFSAGDSIKVTVFGSGSHGSMPHLGVDPVVLGSNIVLRLQTIVSRSIPPGTFGVVTVGAFNAGSKSNVIGDRAELLLNVRTFETDVRDHILAEIEHIVRSECESSHSPRDPEFAYYDQFPLTNNDAATHDRVRAAFDDHFGDRVSDSGRLTASEDFSNIPTAWGVPYCYWTIGGFAPGSEVVPNHNPRFAPVPQPTLRTGTEAAVTAAFAYLG
jgi:hippurate hydrolase